MQASAELLNKFYDMGQKNETEKNMASALRCYKWAAERECFNSQLALIRLDEAGCTTIIDKPQMIIAYFKVGCANYYGDIPGTPQNFKLARKYLQKINEADLPSLGHLILGLIYYHGHGMEKVDRRNAHLRFNNVIAVFKEIRDNKETRALGYVHLGISYLGEGCREKSLHEANRYIYIAFVVGESFTDQLITLVNKAISELTIDEHFLLIEHLIEKKISNADPTYTFGKTSGLQFSLYSESLEKKLNSKKTRTEQEKIIEKKLIAYKERITILSPDEALNLAIAELKKTTMRKNFLTRFLSIAEDDQEGAGLYYRGLCTIANFIDGERGSDLIQQSAKAKRYPEAMEFMTLYSPPEKGSNQVELYLTLGEKAQKKGIYRIAKFLYGEAKKLIGPSEKEKLRNCLKHIAVLEVRMGDFNTGKNYFDSLCKHSNDPDICHKAIELYTNSGHINEAITLLSENKALLKRLSQESTEPESWQQTLYGIHTFSEAQQFFDRNDMKQGIDRVRISATTGYMPAKIKLALCYLEGWGVERSLQNAFQCFLAIKTDPVAAYYLGILSVCKIGLNMTEQKLQDYFKGFSHELITDYLAKCSSATGLVELGDKAFASKMYRIATLHYKAASEQELNNTVALLKIALCHIKWTEWNIALDMTKEILQQEPSNQEAILATLECLTRLNNLDEAIKLLKYNQALYQSAIATCQDKRSWQKTLYLAFESQKSYETPLPVFIEEPVKPQPVELYIQKSSKPKRRKNRKPKSSQLWEETIFSCITIDDFMKVFYDIGQQPAYLQAELFESLTSWVNDHPQYTIDILQKLQEQPDFYEKYIAAWTVIPVEQTVITPVETKTSPLLSSPVNLVEIYPELPEKKVTKVISLTPTEKKTIRQKNADRLSVLEPLMTCITRMSWCIKNQLIQKVPLLENDLTQFETWITNLQDLKKYQLLCDTYSWFIISKKNLAFSQEFETNFVNMQKSMSDIHQHITELIIQLSQIRKLVKIPEEWKIQSEDSFARQKSLLKQLKDILNNFEVIRQNMNVTLKTTGCLFTPRPFVIDELFEMFGAVSKQCWLTGSVLRKILNHEKKVLDTDADFVLGDADHEKLIALGFFKIPDLNNMTVYSKKIWFRNVGLIPVDVLCKPVFKNWLLEDARHRALKRELYQDKFSTIHDISGEAFFHLDNNIIAIPGDPAKRVQQDPTLLLRVTDDILRIIKNEIVPTIEENTLTALNTWIKDTTFSSHADHINAVARKYITKWGAVIFAQKLQEYGLLARIFDITHEDDWEKTAAILNKQVEKKQRHVAPLPIDGGSQSTPSLGRSRFGLYPPVQSEDDEVRNDTGALKQPLG